MSKKIVHIVGTGTIGEPLTGLFCDLKSELGIDGVTFHKNTPLTTDRSKVHSLIDRGQDSQLMKKSLKVLKIWEWTHPLLLKKQLTELPL